jgi:hypothetical protein
VVAGMNYKLELQTSGGNFEATVYSVYHCHPSNAAVHKLTCQHIHSKQFMRVCGEPPMHEDVQAD